MTFNDLVSRDKSTFVKGSVVAQDWSEVSRLEPIISLMGGQAPPFFFAADVRKDYEKDNIDTPTIFHKQHNPWPPIPMHFFMRKTLGIIALHRDLAVEQRRVGISGLKIDLFNAKIK